MKKTYNIIASLIILYWIMPSCDIIESPYMTEDNNNEPTDTSSFTKSQFRISNTLILGGAIKRVADILDPLDE